METLLPFESIPPTSQHTATIIFLHGLGHSNVTWRAAMRTALANQLPHVLWIFPEARKRYVNMSREEKNAWFSVNSLPPGSSDFDSTGVDESVAAIERLVLSQIHIGVDPRRIVLAGFSQGGAIGMLTAFTSLHDLGGVASLSGWLPEQIASSIYSPPNLPILWCHGSRDRDIPISMARSALTILVSRFGVATEQISFRTYEDLGHGLCDKELEDFGAWLRHVIG